jgi:hypothetical protein
VELTDHWPGSRDHLAGFEVYGGQPHADAEYPTEIAQGFLLGRNAIERGHRRQQLARRACDTAPVMDRSINPFVQRRVELLRFGREYQHVLAG